MVAGADYLRSGIARREEVAVLTVDGVGEWTTATLGKAMADWDGTGRNAIELFSEIKFPHSLGLLYSAFTAFLGFRVNNGEYKVMSMAPYGRPTRMDDVYKLIEVGEDGGFGGRIQGATARSIHAQVERLRMERIGYPLVQPYRP